MFKSSIKENIKNAIYYYALKIFGVSYLFVISNNLTGDLIAFKVGSIYVKYYGKVIRI